MTDLPSAVQYLEEQFEERRKKKSYLRDLYVRPMYQLMKQYYSLNWAEIAEGLVE